MVVLLAGVWIVSFPPSGAHGINVGTWGEREEVESEVESNVSIDIHEPYEDEPLPIGGSQASSRPTRDERIGMARVSSRDASHPSPLHDNAPLPQPAEQATYDSVRSSPKSTRSNASHRRRQTDSILPSSMYNTVPSAPSSPSHRRRPSIPLVHHHTTQGPQTSPRQPFPPYTSPLTPGAPGGFSIGLSPVSPGFALVPRERAGRRRRLTSIDSEADFFSAARRTNDGDAHVSGEGGHDLETPASPGSAHDIEASGLHVGGRPTKGRWKWLSGVLAFRDKLG